MSVTLVSVVKQLTDSGIIASGNLERFIDPQTRPESGQDLLRALCKENLLTKFQAREVAAGRVNSLILGSYTILKKIGEGGMGQVFKAQHRRMERVVALKTLPPSVTRDAAVVARFEREAKAAARLLHPNIVTAFDADQANGVWFLVMEYVEGQDLSALVKEHGPLPVGKAVNYLLQAATGLEFAHGKGVVHRDIKPANLILDNAGTIKILDMGLARLESDAHAAAQAELTGTGAVMGTVDYMAPEQALDSKHADQRADIYSLGISLYYLIAGKAAYGGDSLMQKLFAHREHPIPALQDIQANVPKPLEAVFRTMVAKKVEDRYQTMTEVVEALESLGLGGLGSTSKRDAATLLTLSEGERKKLASKKTKKTAGSLTKPAAAEKAKYLVAKIVGGSFATIIAPILVTYLIKYLDGDTPPPKPSAATAPAATVPPVVAAVHTISQPTELTTPPAAVPTVAETAGITPEPTEPTPSAPTVPPVAKTAGITPQPTEPTPPAPTVPPVAMAPRTIPQPTEVKAPAPAVPPSAVAIRVAPPPTPPPSPSAGRPDKPWNTLAFQQWTKEVAALPAETQVEAVAKKLQELNPGFDGTLNAVEGEDAPKIENGVVTELWLITDNVTDISPVRALTGLRAFACQGTSPRSGKVSDLSPLQGMRLTILNCQNTQVFDLSSLKGMELTELDCSGTPMSNLSPLQGMPLTELDCADTAVSDLSSLIDCEGLTKLDCSATKITRAGLAALRKALPDCAIKVDP